MDAHIAVPLPPAEVPSQAPPAPPGPWTRLRQFLFGDDIFISYSRADAAGYSLKLADALTKLGFSCFLDQWGTESRDDLPEGLKAALRASGALVVIASPGAAQSRWVADEIDLFRGLQRPILPISIDGAEREAAWRAHVAGLALTYDTLDRLVRGDPEPIVITRIRNALEFRKRRYRLRRAFWMVALATFVLGAISVVSVRSARAEAEDAQIDAAGARARAEQDSIEADLAREGAKRDSADAAESRRLKDEADRQLVIAKDSVRDARAEQARAEALALRASGRAAAAQAQADAELRRATSIQFTSEATGTLASNPGRALRLALRAVDTEDNILSRRVLVAALRRHPRLLHLVSHPGRHIAYSITFSPNGSRLALGMSDGRVRLWSLNDRSELLADSVHVPPDGESTLGMPVAFSPDGRWLVSGGDEGKIVLWRAADGGRIDSLQLPHPVQVMAFSRGGVLAASSSYGDGIRLLRIGAAGRLEAAAPIDMGDNRHVYTLAFSATGDTLVAGGYQALYLIDAASGVLRDSLATHSYSYPTSVAFSPDGALLAAADADDVVRLWRTDDLRAVEIGEEPIRGTTLGFTQDRVVTGTYSGLVRAWKPDADGRWVVEDTLAEYPKEIQSLAVNSAGTVMASAALDGTVALWAVAQPRRVEWDAGDVPGANEPLLLNRLYNTAIDTRGRHLLIVDSGGVRMEDIDTGDTLFLPLPGVTAAALHPSGDMILAGTRDRRLLLWRRESPGLAGFAPLSFDAGIAQDILFSADGRLAAISDTAGRVVLMDLDTARPVGDAAIPHANSLAPALVAGKGGVLAISPDNRRVLTRDLVVSDVARGPVRHLQLPLLDSGVGSAVFTDGGRQVLALLSGGEIVRWRPDESPRGEIVDSVVSENPDLHRRELRDAEFSQDGHYVAVEYSDDSPMVWDVINGRPLFTGTGSLLNPDMAFSGDGSMLVIRDDRVLRYIDLSLDSWRRSVCSILDFARRPDTPVTPGCRPSR